MVKEDLFTKYQLNREEVMKWYRESQYPEMGFGENPMLAASLYIQQVLGTEPDLTAYIDYPILPLSEFGVGTRGNVKIVLINEVPGTKRDYAFCPTEGCFKLTKPGMMGRYTCEIHGDIGKPIMGFRGDMSGSDGTLGKPMRFEFLPWAVKRAVRNGLVKTMNDLRGRPIILDVEYAADKVFKVHDILAFPQGPDGEPIKATPPAPQPVGVEQPAVAPLKPAPAIQPATPAKVAVPEDVKTKLLDILKDYREEGGITIDSLVGWLSTLPVSIEEGWEVNREFAQKVVDSVKGVELYQTSDGKEAIRLAE